MLNFCAKHDITATVEIITLDRINEAFDRIRSNDVKYRFVVDIEKSFSAQYLVPKVFGSLIFGCCS